MDRKQVFFCTQDSSHHQDHSDPTHHHHHIAEQNSGSDSEGRMMTTFDLPVKEEKGGQESVQKEKLLSSVLETGSWWSRNYFCGAGI